MLIDNYVDDTVLTMLDKKGADVTATIYTEQISRSFQLDIDRHNSQYGAIDTKVFQNPHDRFLNLISRTSIRGLCLTSRN